MQKNLILFENWRVDTRMGTLSDVLFGLSLGVFVSTVPLSEDRKRK